MKSKMNTQTDRGAQRALFIGRFQPLHKGHMSAIHWILERHEEVVVVIGSPNKPISYTNPFTVGERIEMLRMALSEKELAKVILITIPDINNDSLWPSHVLSYSPKISTIYSNNDHVNKLFGKYGIKVEKTPIFSREQHEGTGIREMMAEGDNDWKKRVPLKIVKYLEEIGDEKRLRKLKEE